MIEYAGILILLFMSAGLAGVFLFLSAKLGPKHRTPVKAEPFECGEYPLELPRGGFAVKFYIVAMLFILFDIELVFLFPWAVLYRSLGWFGFVEMALFVLILGAGYIYAWRRGVLDLR